MARKGTRKTSGKSTTPYTKVYSSWPSLLHDAGLNGSEWAVLVALAQHPQRNGLLSRPVADYGSGNVGLATATGLSDGQVRKALAGLCRKTFTLSDGTTSTVLTRKVTAHRGKVAVFKLNLPQRLPRISDEVAEDGERDSATTGTEATAESVTNQEHNEPEKGYQIGPSCVPNQSHHLEKGKGGQKTHPPLPWLR